MKVITNRIPSACDGHPLPYNSKRFYIQMYTCVYVNIYIYIYVCVETPKKVPASEQGIAVRIPDSNRIPAACDGHHSEASTILGSSPGPYPRLNLSSIIRDNTNVQRRRSLKHRMERGEITSVRCAADKPEDT